MRMLLGDRDRGMEKIMRFFVSRSFLFGVTAGVIKDEQGIERFRFLNSGKVGYSFELFDMKGTKCAEVKQMISLSNKFTVKTDVKDIIILFKHKLKINGDAYCRFKGIDWSTEGDIHHHNYSIRDGSSIVARVRLTGTEYRTDKIVDMTDGLKALQNEKQRSLEIDLTDGYDDPLTLAVVMAVELAEQCDGSRYSG